jgi:isopentenyl-diphosphate Delta-isomerase
MEHPIIYTDYESHEYSTNIKEVLIWKNLYENKERKVLDLLQGHCLLQVPKSMHIPTQATIILITRKNNNLKISGEFTYYKKSIAKFIIHQQDLQKYHSLLTSIRKNQHIDICRSHDVEAKNKYTGFAKIQFHHSALPEIDIDKINYKTTVLGKTFSYPILITGMTGGIEKGALINRRLAAAANKFNIPMGVGSQRIALENKEYSHIFCLKNKYPNLFLIGNIGFLELLATKDPLGICRKAVDMISADALAIHINLIQELIQEEGSTYKKNFYKVLEKISSKLKVPILIKEVGCGISPNIANRLYNSGANSIDIGGRGGTSWGYIEGIRSQNQITSNVASTFRNWGIPTAHNLAAIKQLYPHLPIIATGGIRDGLTVAKAVAIGAQACGIGLPLFKAALHSTDKVIDSLTQFITELKICMLATGSNQLDQLCRNICWEDPYETEFKQYVLKISKGTTSV